MQKACYFAVKQWRNTRLLFSSIAGSLFARGNAHVPGGLYDLVIRRHKLRLAGDFSQRVMSNLAAEHCHRLAIILILDQVGRVYAELCCQKSIIGGGTPASLLVARNDHPSLEAGLSLDLIR